MKIGINLQDDRISCEVIREAMNSRVAWRGFFECEKNKVEN